MGVDVHIHGRYVEVSTYSWASWHIFITNLYILIYNELVCIYSELVHIYNKLVHIYSELVHICDNWYIFVAHIMYKIGTYFSISISNFWKKAKPVSPARHINKIYLAT